jgi:GNAT superfamily N-acetyltransferase
MELSDCMKGEETIVRVSNCAIMIIDDPKNFFSRTNESDALINELRVIAADSFGVEIEDKSLRGIRDHVINVDVCALCFLDEILVGFASVRILEKDNILFLHGIAIREKIQARGIGSLVMEILIDYCKNKTIAFTAQNPVMYDLLIRFCNKIFPSPGQNVPETMYDLGCHLAGGRNGIFDPKSFTIKNLYSQCLYPQIPKSKNMIVDQWFEKALRFESDRSTRDGILLIGKIKK